MGGVDQLDRNLPLQNCGRPLKAGQRDIVAAVQQTVHLSAGGFEQNGHFVFRDFPLLHGLPQLPGNDLSYGQAFSFFEDAFFS